jgi:hypothetical protein
MPLLCLQPGAVVHHESRLRQRPWAWPSPGTLAVLQSAQIGSKLRAIIALALGLPMASVYGFDRDR